MVFSQMGTPFPVFFEPNAPAAIAQPFKDLIRNHGGRVVDKPEAAYAIIIIDRHSISSASLISHYSVPLGPNNEPLRTMKVAVLDYHWIMASIEAGHMPGPPTFGGHYIQQQTLASFFSSVGSQPAPAVTGPPPNHAVSSTPPKVSPRRHQSPNPRDDVSRTSDPGSSHSEDDDGASDVGVSAVAPEQNLTSSRDLTLQSSPGKSKSRGQPYTQEEDHSMSLYLAENPKAFYQPTEASYKERYRLWNSYTKLHGTRSLEGLITRHKRHHHRLEAAALQLRALGAQRSPRTTPPIVPHQAFQPDPPQTLAQEIEDFARLKVNYTKEQIFNVVEYIADNPSLIQKKGDWYDAATTPEPRTRNTLWTQFGRQRYPGFRGPRVWYDLHFRHSTLDDLAIRMIEERKAANTQAKLDRPGGGGPTGSRIPPVSNASVASSATKVLPMRNTDNGPRSSAFTGVSRTSSAISVSTLNQPPSESPPLHAPSPPQVIGKRSAAEMVKTSSRRNKKLKS